MGKTPANKTGKTPTAIKTVKKECHEDETSKV